LEEPANSPEKLVNSSRKSTNSLREQAHFPEEPVNLGRELRGFPEEAHGQKKESTTVFWGRGTSMRRPTDFGFR